MLKKILKFIQGEGCYGVCYANGHGYEVPLPVVVEPNKDLNDYSKFAEYNDELLRRAHEIRYQDHSNYRSYAAEAPGAFAGFPNNQSQMLRKIGRDLNDPAFQQGTIRYSVDPDIDVPAIFCQPIIDLRYEDLEILDEDHV